MYAKDVSALITPKVEPEPPARTVTTNNLGHNRQNIVFTILGQNRAVLVASGFGFQKIYDL